MVKIAFVETLADDLAQPNPGWKHRVVQNLVMSPAALEATIKYLTDTQEMFRNQGVLHRAAD